MSGRGRQSFGRVSQRSQGTEVKVSPSARSTKERTRPGGAAHQATQPPPISQGGFKDLVVGNPWRSELAEWASRTGFIDGFRSECWNPAAASPAAGGWRSQLGDLSLAELIGGATWRSGLAEWVGGATWRSDLAEWVGGVGESNGIHRRFLIRVPGDSAAALPAAGGWRSQLGGLSLADLIGGATWRSDLAERLGGATWRSELAE
jgi:hypothetical protein